MDFSLFIAPVVAINFVLTLAMWLEIREIRKSQNNDRNK